MITDFFHKELPYTKQQETEPEQQVMPMFLKTSAIIQLTSVPRRKGPVGQPRRVTIRRCHQVTARNRKQEA